MKAGPLLLTVLLALVGVSACSDLSSSDDVPVAIEIRAPAGPPGSPPPVEIGDTLQLTARALNQAGDSVAATFEWRTPDTAFLYVESTTGRITGKLPGTGRVQVLTGTLTSELVTFAVVPAAESLVIVGSDSARVLVTDTASAQLIAELDTLNPTGPLAGRQIIYQLITIFRQPGDTVSLAGGGFVRTVTTSALGQPIVPVYVRPIPSLARPDSVIVEITALRPSGVLIPGSGQRFIVRFD
jgi:hypothetical protein